MSKKDAEVEKALDKEEAVLAAEAEAEVLEEAGEPTASVVLLAHRSAGFVDGDGEVVVASGEVVIDEINIDDPDFALEVAGKLATAAHAAIKERAEAVANEAAAEAAESPAGSAAGAA